MINGVSLGEVCKITAGQSAPQDSDAFGEEGHPFIRAGSLEALTNGGSEDDCEHISDDDATRFRMKLFPKDTILFAKSGMSAKIGRIYRLKKPSYIVSHLAAVIPGKDVDPGYLQWWFERNPPSRLIPNMAYPSIRTSEISALKIDMPKKDEQKRIAAILDKVDDIRRKRQKAIQLADDFLRSMFLDMFGDPKINPKQWGTSTLEAICDPDKIITYGIVQAGPEYPGGIPYIKTGDFVDGQLREGKYSLTSPEIAASYKRSEVKTGDLIYCIRASVGAVDLLPEWLDCANLTQGTARIAPKDDQDRHFWLYQLKTKGFLDWINRRMKGATFKEITLGALREAPVITPPVELQKEFGGIARNALTLKFRIINASNECADILFKSSQQRAFRGEL